MRMCKNFQLASMLEASSVHLITLLEGSGPEVANWLATFLPLIIFSNNSTSVFFLTSSGLANIVGVSIGLIVET